MTLSIFKRRFCNQLVTVSAIAILLGGCSMDDNKSKVSDDVSALRNILILPAGAQSARWEIFGTPEYTGGVPGPTDYMTRVAEIKLPDGSNEFSTNSGQESVYIVPEAARPWISNDVRSILDSHKNSTLDLSTTKDCHAYTAKLKQTGNPVNGFACAKPGRVFLYLSLL